MKRVIMYSFLLSGCGTTPRLSPPVYTHKATIILGNSVGVSLACVKAGSRRYQSTFNGCYDINNKTIYISENGTESVFNILRHELCHALTGLSVRECHILYPAR